MQLNMYALVQTMKNFMHQLLSSEGVVQPAAGLNAPAIEVEKFSRKKMQLELINSLSLGEKEKEWDRRRQI